jgi:hypothetical protein
MKKTAVVAWAIVFAVIIIPVISSGISYPFPPHNSAIGNRNVAGLERYNAGYSTLKVGARQNLSQPRGAL